MSPNALRPFLRSASSLLVVLLLIACSGDDPFSPSDPGVEITGDLQVAGTVGQVVSPAPVVRVRDGDDRPVQVAVRLEVDEGSVTEDAATDEDGRLRVEDWVLGEAAGRQQLTAWVGDEVLATIRADAEADVPTAISGFDFEEVEAGAVVPLAVGLLADGFGNPAAELELQVRRGSEVLLETRTEADGAVDLGGWSASEAAGVDTLELWASGADPIAELVVPVRAGAPEALVVEAELSGPVRAGDVLSNWGAAAVVDAFGNVVEGPDVTFSATAGMLTDAGGASSAGSWLLPDWDLGPEVGPATLVARTDAMADSLELEVGPGAPTELRVSPSIPDTAQTGDVLQDPATVEVRDVFQNPVPDVVVEAHIVEGSPEVSPAQAVTNDDGVAHFEEWAVGVGRESVRFRADGVESEAIGLDAILGDDAFQVTGIYVNQGNNRPEGAPAVRSRPGQLRILGHMAAGIPLDQIRVYARNGGTVVGEKVVTGPIPSVPSNPQVDDAGWVLELRGEDVQPGLEVEVELVAGGQRVASFGPETLEVADVPVLRKYFVPIRLQELGTTGPITAGTVEDAMQDVWRWMPINEMEVEIGPVLSTDRDLSDRDEWSALLRDLVELRWDLVASGEITPDTYIHGILPTSIPGSGIGGIGYRPVNPGSAFLASLSRMNSGTIAHELGHNLGRRHTPCGNPAGVRSFPHSNARIGYPGYNVDTHAEVDSDVADFMSYCGPRWTSDVKYVEIFQWRSMPQYQPAAVLPAAGGPANAPILVQGTVTPDGAELQLRPARALPPQEAGVEDGVLTALDLDGTVLGTWRVALVEVPDAGEGVHHFARAIDLPSDTEVLRFEAVGGQVAELTGGATAAMDPVAGQVVAMDGGVRVTWDPDRVETVSVRVNGHLRGVGSSGALFIPDADTTDVEVTGTAGLRTQRLWPR